MSLVNSHENRLLLETVQAFMKAELHPHEDLVDRLGEVPLDPNVATASDEGNPVVVSDPTSAAARTYARMARRIVEKAKPFET